MNRRKNSTPLLALTLAMVAFIAPTQAAPSPDQKAAAALTISQVTVPEAPIPVNTTFHATITTVGETSSAFADWMETDPLVTYAIQDDINPQVWHVSHSYERPGLHQFMTWATNGADTVQKASRNSCG